MAKKQDARLEATLKGIDDAFAGIHHDVLVTSLGFIYNYAMTHEYFNGGDILRAYRHQQPEEIKRNWRNKWGSLIRRCADKEEWFVRVGKEVPTSSQSHTDTLTQWRSSLYKGPKQPRDTAVKFLNGLRDKVMSGQMNMTDALWKAYARGADAPRQK